MERSKRKMMAPVTHNRPSSGHALKKNVWNATMRAFSVLCLLFLNSPVTGWAACYSVSNNASTSIADLNASVCFNTAGAQGSINGTGLTCSASKTGTANPFNYNVIGTFCTSSGVYYASSVSCALSTGTNTNTYSYTIRYCTTQAEADSVKCSLNPSADGCHIPDTTYTCISVSTENGVIRSSIQKYIDGVASGNSIELLYSCKQNNFCEGSYDESMLANDSCSYDSISSENCRYGGQDGSACFYVCPDGQNHLCRMFLAMGGTIPQCPSKPWKSCSDSINRSPNPNKNYNPNSYNPPSDSLSIPPDDTPSSSDEILVAIRDTLHHANEQRKYQMYVQENTYDAIAGYGAFEDDGIVQNLRNVNVNTRATQTATQSVATNTANMVTGMNNLVTIFEDSTIKAEIVSMPDSIYTFSSSTPMVYRIDTTLQTTQDLIQQIRDLTDTLVSDTPRTNSILGRITPSIDSALAFFVDNSPVGFVQGLAKSFADSISAKIQPFYDFVIIDSTLVNGYNSEIDSTLSSWENPYLQPYDSTKSILSFDYDENDAVDSIVGTSLWERFNHQNDSIVNHVDSLLKERSKQDSIQDTLPIDEMAGDSAKIRDKLENIFLPDDILYECFDYHLEHTFRVTLWNKSFSWDLSLVIDFADLFGLDLCDLIRKIVQLLTFILIVFTTIKGYIRAFGGGDTL